MVNDDDGDNDDNDNNNNCDVEDKKDTIIDHIMGFYGMALFR